MWRRCQRSSSGSPSDRRAKPSRTATQSFADKSAPTRQLPAQFVGPLPPCHEMKIRCRAMRGGRCRSCSRVGVQQYSAPKHESRHEQIHPHDRDCNPHPAPPGDRPKASPSQGWRSPGQHPATRADRHGCQPDPGRQSAGQRARGRPGQLGRLPAQGRGHLAAQGWRSSGWLPESNAQHRRRQFQHRAGSKGQTLRRSGLAIQRLPACTAAELPGRPK
ncbi:hypothetical protein D3C78_754000 [compost metagenome]